MNKSPRPLPVRGLVSLRPRGDIWHKPALSAGFAVAVPDLVLLALGRTDLVIYLTSGAMCALYTHGLPYAARARALLWVVLGMVAGVGVALTTSALVDSAVVLVLCASVLAAVHKVLCDATRIGPPGNLIFTFIAASCFFAPQRLAEVPAHTGLALLGGAVAWLVCMAPALVRPRGPERIATARALEAAARLLRAPGDGAARAATAAAVNAAWHTLFAVSGRSTAAALSRAGLERLLVRASAVLAGDGHGPEGTRDPDGGRDGPGHGRGPADATETEAEAEAVRLLGWAREVRGGGPLPAVTLTPRQDEELTGALEERLNTAAAEGPAAVGRGAHRRGGPRPGRHRSAEGLLHRLRRPHTALWPLGLRTATGCALAGWLSLAAGVGHPYWAVVTAASVFQANTALSWQRAVQRTLGNLLGLLVFALLLPVSGLGALAMVLLVFVLQVAAEALMPRNYWLGSVCVTPMALLLSEFGSHSPAGRLIGDRLIDTVLGAVVGVLVCVLVTNRRAGDRIEAALGRVEEAGAAALAAVSAARTGPSAPVRPGVRQVRARDRLVAALAELREAVDTASGEWWQRALPEERVAEAERAGHRALHRLAAALRHPVAV
ncbi:FUSC family protein [Streptomyces cacaoi]|uniref:FUSC family protein n=1 Tax=Streptomyces cacaoi TaxID=1898 RepID=UPI00374A3323